MISPAQDGAWLKPLICARATLHFRSREPGMGMTNSDKWITAQVANKRYTRITKTSKKGPL